MNRWEITYHIESYVNFFNQFSIDGVKFYHKDRNNYASLEIQAFEMCDAEKQGEDKLRETLKTIEFTINQRINYGIIDIKQINKEDNNKLVGASYVNSSVAVRRPFPDDQLKSIENFFSKLNEMDKIGRIAYESYLRGLEVGEWYNEAFLNFYKAIEVIAGTYLNEGKKEKEIEVQSDLDSLVLKLKKNIESNSLNVNRIKSICTQIHKLGFVETKMKMHLALKDLGLDKYDEDLDVIVNYRNEFVAHGSSSKMVEISELEKCKEISKEMILKYIEKH
ncbi:hypothetical protein Q9R46_07120 [Paenibacillus sp. RRE4]|uniref:hypothetical protein n=1 Tax=Paenibacillus sp. RRE4 TaxID=2962587 RepID=UPI002880E952|nr:hypothetical protein [Paenibacillus sp. RRE4]MDT0122404.1 hypothetical protein [Paenibacillus sp. RRE4]